MAFGYSVGIIWPKQRGHDWPQAEPASVPVTYEPDTKTANVCGNSN